MKTSDRHAEAYRYLRLMWLPRKGDRVIYQGKKTRVVSAHKSKGVLLLGKTKHVLPGQTIFRPTPRDFSRILDRLGNLWVYKELLGVNKLIVGVKINGRTLPITGRPARILSQVLALRVIDPTINIEINKLFEKYGRQKVSDVRIFNQRTTQRHPG